MGIPKSFFAFFLLTLLGVGLTIAGDGIKPVYKPAEKAYYLTDAQASFVRPGLQLIIQKVEYNQPTVKVTFQITDASGQPLDRLGINTPGAVSTSFILARIRPGDTQYTNYFANTVTSLPAPGCANCTVGNTATQATTDSGGVYSDLGNGVYTYTFGKQLPANVDVDSTNTLGMYARRDLSTFGFPLNSIGTVANATLDFVPNGSPVTQVRDVVTTAACNQCHDPLNVHGGARQEVRLCILCHQPQTTDPETGNTVDFKVFIHKIHNGSNLPSVTGKAMNINTASGNPNSTELGNGSTPEPIEEGTPVVKPYQIVGFNQSVNDWSSVVWPQDVRNCTTCHQGGKQSDNWKTNPNRAACGSCHDDVNFDTGKNHVGGPQADDSKCSGCHPADGQEFDLSVSGIHTIPAKSKQLPGLNVQITGVTNANPGSKPTVSFTVQDGKGNPLNAAKLTSLGFLMAGPTSDYTFVTRSALTAGEKTGSPGTENALTTVKATSTGFTYTFSTALPADAQGTFAIGVQSSNTVTIPGPLVGQSFSATDFSSNPVYYFGVGGATATPRRRVVDTVNCNSCHKSLALHGGGRVNGAEFCQMCHNPASTDQPDGSRAAGFTVPAGTVPETINLRTLAHRLHRGENLENEFTIYRTRGVFGFNGVRFPGDLRDCAKCHVNNSNQLPLPDGMANTVGPREFYSPLGPAASACLGCHDGEDAAAHTYVMTSPFGESCPVCHAEGADFAVSKVHAR